MSWEAGVFVLTEGASCTVEFNWQGKYHGTQYAMARPIMDLGPFLGKIYGERMVNTSSIGVTGRRKSEEPEWIYRVTVQNMNTDAAVFFTLTGGEV